jgi:Flp pilus assembly protein TadG
MRLEKKNNRESGTVIVETAFTVLLLFTFLFAIMEAGRLFNVQQTLTDAAREGARLGVTPLTQTNTLPNTTDIQNAVTVFLNAAAITGATVEVNNPAPPANFTRVRVTAPYQLITLSMFSNLQMNLRGEALMRNETSP